MISIRCLSVAYNEKTKVLDALSVDLEANIIHGIVGLNGAGKTTFLNAIYGIVKYKLGTILYNGRKIEKKDIAYLVTESFFYSNITGREYLALFENTEFDDDKWNGVFLLPLDELIDNYSTGMKKKLALMGILKQDKPILILDEPFNGLDIETCRNIRMILLRLKEKGKTILITSHIMETLTNLCDKIHYLENGTIRYSKEQHEFVTFEKEIFESIEQKNANVIFELTD